MSDDKKFAEVEKGAVNMDEDETVLTTDTETMEMLPTKGNGDVKIKVSANEFYGLTKEQLEETAKDPFWVKVRWILFAIFLVGWISMLVAAIVIVVLAPKCPPRPTQQWWQKDVAYSVLVPEFKDSDNDKVGDLKGIEDSIKYFNTLGVKTLLLSDIVDAANLKSVDKKCGNDWQFDGLVKLLHKKDQHVILEIEHQKIKDSNEEKFGDVLSSWLERGVDGIYISGTALLDISPPAEGQLRNVFYDWKDRLAAAATQTDRPRVLALDGQPALADLSLDTPLPAYGPACGNLCLVNLLKAVPKSNSSAAQLQDKWPSVVFGDRRTSRLASRAGKFLDLLTTVQLTLKGTPIVYYGDEIGMRDIDAPGKGAAQGPMQWTGSPANWSSSNPYVVDASVQAQTAAGFKSSSLKLFEHLVKIRSAPSLQWGETHFGHCSGIVAYTRKAEGFPSYLVAVNAGIGPGSAGIGPGSAGNGPPFVGNLADCCGSQVTQGTVVAIAPGFTKFNDLDIGNDIDISSVYLPDGYGLVIKLADG